MTDAAQPPAPPVHQRIVPYTAYHDPRGMIEWLGRAFGFEPGMLIEMPDGSVGHAELHLADGETIMLSGVYPELGVASPRDFLPNRHAQILVYVDNVDAHYEHAKAHGAEISSEPRDQPYGDRTYQCRDPEGGFWSFHQHIRDVGEDEINAAMASVSEAGGEQPG